MAYMRGTTYVYSDGLDMNFYAPGGHLKLPMETCDEFVAMHWFRMTPDEQQAAMRRAAEKHAGNFGADGVREALGLPTAMDMLKELTARHEGRN